MQIGGKEVKIKDNLKLIHERNALHIGDIGEELFGWMKADEPNVKALEKLEARWKKICEEIFENPQDIPGLRELGLAGVRDVAQDFFDFVLPARKSTDS